MLNVAQELTELERLTVDQLRGKYADVFGEATNGRHKEWLIKRIVWRLQANAEGGLSERARQRAMEIANDADLRTTPPRPRKSTPDATDRTVVRPVKLQRNTEILSGTVLQRAYKGQTIRVAVLAVGFEYAGQRYKSLTAVAKAVTGKHWNGFHFFGLRGNGAKR